MIYYDPKNETITDGFAVLRTEAENPEASSASRVYYNLLVAIAKGEGFDYLCNSTNMYDLNKADFRNILKELLYAIETERITDRHTHRDIVEETLENVLSLYV